MYSNNCTPVKIKPKIIVSASPKKTCERALYPTTPEVGAIKPAVIALCAQVTVTPDDNKIAVFNKGNPQGLIVWIPNGGQTAPIQIEGDTLEWKKAQKKLKKNIISETINKIKPILKPFCTANVWCPSNVASIMISQNQLIIENKNDQQPSGKKTVKKLL